jgi:hypothetical protein
MRSEKRATPTRAKTTGLPPLLPAPKRVRRRRGELRLPPSLPIFLPAPDRAAAGDRAASDPSLERSLLLGAQALARRWRASCGVELAIERPRTVPRDGPAIVCRLDRRAALSPKADTARDAYRLTVSPRGIELAAPTLHGLRYGLQTLGDLARRGGRIPALEILDQPDFRDRGVMLDVSRGRVPRRATLEALVDLCARLRLNVLMLYVEHTFAFRRHPEIGAGASPLDAETILALDAYAADRGVELVPCLQSLGHMERVLSLPRYRKLAESDRRWSVSPSRPETYAFLEDLYDEFLPLFRSKRFNANCDEPFDLGRGQSARRAPKKSPGELFAGHVDALERLARKHGKQLMIWADFAYKHADQIPRLAPDTVLIDWWYEASFEADRIAKLRRHGFEFWVSPGTSAWNCLFPRIANSEANIARWAEAGKRHGATGFLNTDWGDFGHYNTLGASLYAYAQGAQQAWSGPTDEKSFDRAFGRAIFGEDSPAFGRLYRRLGAVHDAGFKIFNGSALQYLYFDGLERSFFLQHADRAVLERSARRIEPVLRDVERLADGAVPNDLGGLARFEIAWAAHATALAIEKSLAALDYGAWRADPKSLDARGRRELARRLEELAERQQAQAELLQALWLASSEISEFEKTAGRLRRSITDLAGAARALRANRRVRPPETSSIALLDVYNEMRLQLGLPPRPR